MSKRYNMHRFFFILIAVLAGYAVASASPIWGQHNFEQDTCRIDSGEYRTQTQGSWGQDSCDGNNVACIRDTYFGLVFPSGLTIGGSYTIHFSSSAAVAVYLPRDVTPGVLTQNYVDPTYPTSAGVFASQVLSLKLSVAFGDYPVPSFGDLGSLIIDSGPFANYSVDQLLALANTVLGGNLAALPEGRTLEQLNSTIEIINDNFVDGSGDGGYLHENCCVAPDIVCWSGNPVHFNFGQAVSISAVVTNPDHDPYTVVGRYATSQCASPAPVTQTASHRWTLTVPENCTQNPNALSATFVVTDSCGKIDSVTCELPACSLPTVECWEENPAHFAYGQPLTVCAIVGDPDDDLASVIAEYTAGACHAEVSPTFADGRWCVTIPGNCTEILTTVIVIFTATDSCGEAARDTCLVPADCIAPEAECWDQNPSHFLYGQGLTACAIITDANHDIVSVIASYHVDGCTRTVPAENAGGGRWCVTISDSCTRTCNAATIIFTATDACGLCGVATCVITPQSIPPLVECWVENPDSFAYDQPLTVCAVVSDADGNVTSVMAAYSLGSCQDTVPATNAGSGRWCITIPASCAQFCEDALAVFTATDACGYTDVTSCTIHPRSLQAPHVLCETSDPAQYVPGHPVIAYAAVGDSDNDVVLVTASYATPTCTVIDTADYNSGLGQWYVTISSNCTSAGGDINVTFTATDHCGLIGSFTCLIPQQQIPCGTNVNIHCWPGNPVSYSYGIPISVCAVVDDSAGAHQAVTAHYQTGVCTATVPAAYGAGRWCVVVPAACTQSFDTIRVTFTVMDTCLVEYSSTCTIAPPESPGPQEECCLLCIAEPALVMMNEPVDNPPADINLVIRIRGRELILNWNPVPGAAYYEVCRGDLGAALDQMERVGLTQSGQTDWTEPSSLAELLNQQQYYVRAYQSGQRPALDEADRGQWEMNEGIGDTVHDASGYGRDAIRWSNCPPDWGSEYDSQCDSNSAGYIDFDGYVYDPSRCAEHLRAPNDSVFYADSFQVFARIRIHQHPSSDTGPFYIVSNRTYGTAYSGGFGFRIEPGWYTDGNYVRHWHNRLLGLVWDHTVPDGTWRIIESAQPTPQDTVTNSVPLNEWVCVRMTVSGTTSSLMIDDRVVATGDLTYRSLNTGAPMVIGGGFHLVSLPVENPFRGEMDCVRITDLP
jgi:hypothetical protein